MFCGFGWVLIGWFGVGFNVCCCFVLGLGGLVVLVGGFFELIGDFVVLGF